MQSVLCSREAVWQTWVLVIATAVKGDVRGQAALCSSLHIAWCIELSDLNVTCCLHHVSITQQCQFGARIVVLARCSSACLMVLDSGTGENVLKGCSRVAQQNRQLAQQAGAAGSLTRAAGACWAAFDDMIS
jgi:hypothetical protein